MNNWITLLYRRNYYNIVNELYLNKTSKKNKIENPTFKSTKIHKILRNKANEKHAKPPH